MARTRKILRVGTPLPLDMLKQLLNAIDVPDATVRHINGELIVEAADPTIDE